MATVEFDKVGLTVSDVSEQKQVFVSDLQAGATVGELIEGLLPQMRLPRNDAEGRPLVYQARLDREGRALHGSERVGDAVQPGDRLVLQPNVEAGGGPLRLRR